MDTKSKLPLKVIIGIACIISILLIVGFVYGERNRQIEMTEQNLIDIANRDAVIVYNLFESRINTLRAIAVYLKDYNDLKSTETITFLKKIEKAFEFDGLSIDFADGDSYVTDLIIDENPHIRIQVPIHKNGTHIALLVYTLKREQLNNLLETILSETGKYYYIIDGNGEYISFYSGENSLFSADTNFFDSLDVFEFEDGFSKEMIEQAFTEQKTGHVEYSFESVYRYGYYSPIGINNWIMMSVMSKNDIDADTNRFLTKSLILLAEILFIFLCIVIILYVYRKKEQKRKEDYLRQKADTDGLTGLYNKAAAKTFISEVLSLSNSEDTHALFCFDLDGFKCINDKFGHLYGDKVLAELAGNLKKTFRSRDILGRFGGDEFVVFIRDVPSIEFVKEKAAELNKQLNKTYKNKNIECTISASIGISMFPVNGDSYELLYKKADDASYIIKQSGKNSYFIAKEG